MSAAPIQSAPRKLSAALLRAYAGNLQTHGLTDTVAAHLSPQVRAVLSSPPLATEWIDSSVVYALYEAVGKVGGGPAVRRMCYESMRDTLGHVLKPMVDVTLAIHGRTPEVLFNHLDRIASTFLRDIAVSYVVEGPKSGFIEVRYDQPAVPMAFAAWEGAFSFLVELTGVQATVGVSEPNHALTFGRMHLTWE